VGGNIKDYPNRLRRAADPLIDKSFNPANPIADVSDGATGAGSLCLPSLPQLATPCGGYDASFEPMSCTEVGFRRIGFAA
jgi:hypothetical protein